MGLLPLHLTLKHPATLGLRSFLLTRRFEPSCSELNACRMGFAPMSHPTPQMYPNLLDERHSSVQRSLRLLLGNRLASKVNNPLSGAPQRTSTASLILVEVTGFEPATF